MRDVTSLCLGFPREGDRWGSLPFPGVHKNLPGSGKLPRTPAKQRLPAAKCYHESRVHTHYVALQCTSPLPFPIFGPEWGSPASFPAQWHDLRLSVHHMLEGQGAGTATPHSAACLFFPAMPLLSLCLPTTVNATALSAQLLQGGTPCKQTTSPEFSCQPRRKGRAAHTRQPLCPPSSLPTRPTMHGD